MRNWPDCSALKAQLAWLFRFKIQIYLTMIFAFFVAKTEENVFFSFFHLIDGIISFLF